MPLCLLFSSILFLSFPAVNQAFFFPPSASSCSCPPVQCPASPAAHCIWKRQSGGVEEIAEMIDGAAVEEQQTEGGRREERESQKEKEGKEVVEEDDENMMMVYDDDDRQEANGNETKGIMSGNNGQKEWPNEGKAGKEKGKEATKQPKEANNHKNITKGTKLTKVAVINTNKANKGNGTNSSKESAEEHAQTMRNASGNGGPKQRDQEKKDEEGKKQEREENNTSQNGGGGGGEGDEAKLALSMPIPMTTEKRGEPKMNRNCNSELMGTIMLEALSLDVRPSTAKRQIQSKMSAQFGGRIDVICGRKAFSYIVNSELFCEIEKDGTICLCYSQQS